MKRALACVFALSLLAGCSGASDPAEPKLEMRVYSVPAGQAESLARTLANVLPANGKVTASAPGQLVVTAPASLHASIDKSLRELARDGSATGSGAASDGSGAMRLTFWSVDAVPENGPDDSTLQSLAPALDEARKDLGIVHFELRDHVSGLSSLGERVHRQWSGPGTQAARQLEYTIAAGSPAPMLQIKFSDKVPVTQRSGTYSNAKLADVDTETTTAIVPGQTLLLTQNPVPDGDGASSVMRLYLVRVDPVAAH